ncbi:hypothetical protein FPZ12_014860 [Amycolatopsis acidicola]|uniref:Uncharacterized protein n=1 Tax=Amycolatopsis acidicola TaxID=2596893 RepID=A0A5N0V5G4_9PSEU|nr:hypothetical protein [Amycolatopsis acidicola]KAA9161044.1 hypothetical protein FPZ12_014860 [Amycolatopsis acidicola]
MSELQDPERLLAEALKAQARSAPPPDPAAAPSQLPPQYGLLSGADGGALERERAALGPPTTRQPTTKAKTTPGGLPAYWVLALAVLLGLATGAVIGLITLL